MSDEKKSLSREISAPMLAVYGTGTILGAGIYVLIGKITGEAGYWTPLAFLVAGAVAAVNGLVYAELATRTPHAGGPTDYVQKAFSIQPLTITLGWMIAATGIVSAATIANGFSGYVSYFFDIPEWISKVGLVLLLGAIATAGAKESAWFMAVTTTLGIIGLFFVMYTGFFHVDDLSYSQFLDKLPSLGDLSSVTGILAATFLAVYSFIGFEDLVHMAEEVKKPSRSIPLAIIFSLVVAAIFYFLVSVAALRIMEPQALAESKAPLVDVVSSAGFPGWPLALLSLWIIMNGALAQIVMASRVIYSQGEHNGAPDFLTVINTKTDTPVRATLLSAAIILILTLFFPLKTLAAATSFIMLLVFGASNAALIQLERMKDEAPFDVPKPVPWIGLVICILLVIGKFFFGGGE